MTPAKFDKIHKQLGNRIRALRQSKGLSQEALADTSGLHRSHMGQIERGELNISIDTLARLAGALKAPLVDFLRGVGSSGRRGIRKTQDSP